MNHAVWPEGQPERAYVTTHGGKAFLHLAKMQIIQLWKLASARRMRHATSLGEIDPGMLEQSMRKAGAIPPPGGWPDTKDRDSSAPESEIHVWTHSII